MKLFIQTKVRYFNNNEEEKDFVNNVEVGNVNLDDDDIEYQEFLSEDITLDKKTKKKIKKKLKIFKKSLDKQKKISFNDFFHLYWSDFMTDIFK